MLVWNARGSNLTYSSFNTVFIKVKVMMYISCNVFNIFIFEYIVCRQCKLRPSFNNFRQNPSTNMSTIFQVKSVFFLQYSTFTNVWATSAIKCLSAMDKWMTKCNCYWRGCGDEEDQTGMWWPDHWGICTQSVEVLNQCSSGWGTSGEMWGPGWLFFFVQVRNQAAKFSTNCRCQSYDWLMPVYT